MQDYTYQDMLKMQEDAARRVREMKKRAAIAVGEQEQEAATQREVPLPDEVKRISYPVELPSEGEIKAEVIENPPPREPVTRPPSLGDIFFGDSDSLLLLALIVTLSRENADMPIILALIYLLL